jgi:hypothetical protein
MSRSYSRYSHVICITPIHDAQIVTSLMSLSGDTYESRVYWISDQGHLADSFKMMQSCRYYRKACFSCAHDFQLHSPILILAGDLSHQTQQSIVYMQVRGIVSLLPHAIGITGTLPGQREWSRLKHYVTEGIMKSAEDMTSEATLLIGLS